MYKISTYVLLVFVIVIFGGCSVFYSSKPFERTITIELINKIPIGQQKFNVSMEENGFQIFLPQDTLIELFNKRLMECELELDSCADTASLKYKFNKRRYNKFTKLNAFLISQEHFIIPDVTKIDSLQEIDFFEKRKMIENNVELGFRFSLEAVAYDLFEKGNVSVLKDGLFVDTIYQMYYSSFTCSGDMISSGSISTIFCTKDTVEIYRSVHTKY